ncbi:hypothetical protein GC163_16505 [bacterium]|nr:hypothetical protein [bacterium]
MIEGNPNVTRPVDSRRSGSNQGYVWASRATNIAAVGVVPPALGYWADQSWGTFPWLLIVGGAFGFALLMLEILKLSRPR